MPTFTSTVNIQCDTAEQAEQVLQERLTPEEDYGFSYTVDFSPVTASDEHEVEQAEPYADDDQTYMIIRFVRDGDNEVIHTGLTLEEAKEHCADPETSGDGWFDGFQAE